MELSAERILELLAELDSHLVRRGIEAKLFLVGGAAMALAYNASRVTGDIDGIFEPRDEVLEAAQAIASAHGLDRHWLSDGVSQLMPPLRDDHPHSVRIGRGLTIEVGSPEFILAMKAMSGRQSAGDLDDAVRLCRLVKVTTTLDLERIISRYFGDSGFYGAQELFFERIVDAALEK